MNTISKQDIGTAIECALKEKKRNILFISLTLEYEPALVWFESHPEYRVCRAEPVTLYEKKNGILTQNEDYAVIDDKILNNANNDKCIWFHHAFSEKSVLNFDGFVDIIKNRCYINRFPDGCEVNHDLKNMAMFVAFTTPHNENDWAALNEKYYDLFDEIYVVK